MRRRTSLARRPLSTDTRAALRARIPLSPAVVSLEAFSAADRRAARSRFAIDPRWLTGAGVGRRVARFLHLAGAPYRMRLEWDDRAGEDSVWRRALVLQLPRLREGTYLVRVRVRLAGGAAVERSREVEVRKE